MNSNHVLASDVAVKTIDGEYVLVHQPSITPNRDGAVYFRTILPVGYTIEGREGNYLLGSAYPRKSNLNITTLSLVGSDGIAYAHDVLDTNEAIRILSKMKSANTVDYSDIGTPYVED